MRPCEPCLGLRRRRVRGWGEVSSSMGDRALLSWPARTRSCQLDGLCRWDRGPEGESEEDRGCDGRQVYPPSPVGRRWCSKGKAVIDGSAPRYLSLENPTALTQHFLLL